MAVWRQTGKKPKELAEAPTLPEDLVYLWELFCNLRSPDGLQWTEVEAWCRLTRTELALWELDALRELDAGYQEAINERNRKALNRSRNKGGATGNGAAQRGRGSR